MSFIKTKYLSFIKLLILTFFINFTSALSALECSDIRQLIIYFLRIHYSVHDFDSELSARTLDNFIKAWDPAKVYFLKSDIEEFKSKYARTLQTELTKANCKPIEHIFSRYSLRFEESQAVIDSLIKKKFDFTIDEYINFDRKKISYAENRQENNERLRKKIKYKVMQLKQNLKDPKKVLQKLTKWKQLNSKQHQELDTYDVYSMFINSFATSLDPHTNYLSPRQLEDLRINMALSLEGIGALLRSEDGIAKVSGIIPGGAASKKHQQLNVNDQIMAVAQGANPPVDVIDMDLRDIVNLIRGKRGTEVQLTIRREGKILIVSIIREKIELQDQSVKSFIFELNPIGREKGSYKVGLINLPSFYIDFEGRKDHKKDFTSSSQDVREEIIKLKQSNVDLIVLDLRSNGGGSLDEAVNITGQFIGKEPVVQIKSTSRSPKILSHHRASIYNGPLILMINRLSASASEIIAGTLRDYDRALIVGNSHTFGKGTVQNLIDLSKRLGAIKVTVSTFHLAFGASTQLKGVDSDITIPSIAEYLDIGEKFSENPLPWSEISASSQKNFFMVKSYVPQLKKNSQDRTDKDPDFQKVFDAIKEYKDKKEEGLKASLKIEKSSHDKAKEKSETEKSEAKEEPLDYYKPYEPNLNEDIYLKETMLIAADYLRLLEGRDLASFSIEKYQDSEDLTVAKKDKNKQKISKISPRKTPLEESANKENILPKH